MAQTRLKQLREEAVLTVHELAEASGVSDDTISKIENGQRVARPSTLRKLAHALDVSPQELRRPATAEEPALVGKDKASTTGCPRMTAEQALVIADSDSFRREAAGASSEELQQTALGLARFTKPSTREDLVGNKDNKEVHLKEAHRRVIAQERIGIINVELDRRGAPSPIELVARELVARRFNDATTPPEETPRLGREEQEGKEAG
jgi:transcriptional regulator with XRE-family HTH domain